MLVYCAFYLFGKAMGDTLCRRVSSVTGQMSKAMRSVYPGLSRWISLANEVVLDRDGPRGCDA